MIFVGLVKKCHITFNMYYLLIWHKHNQSWCFHLTVKQSLQKRVPVNYPRMFVYSQLSPLQNSAHPQVDEWKETTVTKHLNMYCCNILGLSLGLTLVAQIDASTAVHTRLSLGHSSPLWQNVRVLVKPQCNFECIPPGFKSICQFFMWLTCGNVK
jgi:hypothetical protein